MLVGKTVWVDVPGEPNRPIRYEPFAPFDDWANLQVNESLWDSYAERIRMAAMDRPSEIVDPSYRKSLIAAAALNSGAIEGLHGSGRGLTLSVIENAVEWQPFVRRAEGSEAEAFVAAGIAGYDMALDIATGANALSEAWIRSLHAVLCDPQETVRVFTERDGQRVESFVPFERGSYKSLPNNVELVDGSVHWYCPVEDVPHEMRRLIETLRSPNFEAAHPVLQAAFAHYAFVAAHPFQDGNGRVARVLASIFLLRSASIPLFIYDDEKNEYFDALEATDRGDRQSFVDFVQRVSLDTLAYAGDLARTGTARQQTAKDPIDHDLQLAAVRLEAFAFETFRKAISAIGVDDDMRASYIPLSLAGGNSGRFPFMPTTVELRVESTVSGVRISRTFRVFVESPNESFPIGIEIDNGAERLDLTLSDVHPSISSRSQLRLNGFAGRVIAELVGRAQDEILYRGG
jgi:Fic family protein